MTRRIWVVLVTTLAAFAPSCAAAPCASDDCAATSAGGGGAATTTNGGAGGSGGATTSSSGEGAGGTSGSGGASTGCTPMSSPCGDAVCGEVDDGCGTPVPCGMCAAGEPCVAGACCIPKTCDAFPGSCDGAMRPDGCGGTLSCGDAICGNGWMSCQVGSCACDKATDYPNAPQSQAHCDTLFPGTTAVYCGEPPNPDVPAGCEYTSAANGGVAGTPRVWCCPPPPPGQ